MRMMRNHTFRIALSNEQMLLTVYADADAVVGATPSSGSTVDVSVETRLFTVDVAFPLATACSIGGSTAARCKRHSPSFTLDGALYGVSVISLTCTAKDVTTVIRTNPGSLGGVVAWTVNILGADVVAPGTISDLFAALNVDSDHAID